MGIFTKLLGGQGVGGQPAPGNRFQRVLDKSAADLDIITADVTTVAGQWVDIGSGFTVPAQTLARTGYGDQEHPDNQGVLYIYFEDTAAAETVGRVRIVQRNAQETRSIVVGEWNLASTHGSKTNRAMMTALPEQAQFPMVGEDSKIILQCYTVAASSVDKDNSFVYIPVTLYI